MFGSRACAAGILAFVSLGASAAEGLAWKGDAPRRFVINSQVQSPQIFRMSAENNLDRRIGEWKMNVKTLCTFDTARSTWEVSCLVEDLSLAARPVRGDAENLVVVLDEWDQMITGSTATFRFGSNGRMTSFELKNLKHTRNNDRVRGIQEAMRLAMARTFAGLDLELPPKGDDKGKVWRTKTSMLMEFPSPSGSAGGMEVNSKVETVEGARAVIETTGTGVRGPAIYSSNGQLANAWQLNLFSRATFDTSQGVLIEREVVSQGEITPSSQLATGGNAPPYVQAMRVVFIPDGEEVEAFGPNELLE